MGRSHKVVGKNFPIFALTLSFFLNPCAFGDVQKNKATLKKSKNSAEGGEKQAKALALPRLIVLITIDQMRADTLERFTPAMKKISAGRAEGLLSLRDEGVWFANAWTASAPTVTASGHASICTGSNPSQHGIVGNEIYEAGRDVRVGSTEDELVQDVSSPEHQPSDPLSRVPGAGSSRRRMKVMNFADLLIQSTRGKSKAVSISIKDRGAVYCGAPNSAGAYWYGYKVGGMMSSTAFMQALPAWVNDFNGRAQNYFPVKWEPVLTLEEMKASLMGEPALRAFAVRSPLSQWFGAGFPYEFRDKDKNALLVRQRFPYTPSASQFLVDFALKAIEQERLGCSSRVSRESCLPPAFPDLLSISFSTTDLVGHAFGHQSPELMDIYLNLNQSLERFRSSLEKQFGARQVLYVVTSDHGVQTLPEVRALFGEGGGRSVAKDLKAGLEKILSDSWGEGPWIAELITGDVHFNLNLMSKKGKTSKAAVTLLKSQAQTIAGVRGVLGREELLKSGDNETDLYRRGNHPERSGDAVILFKAGWTQDHRNAANHGTAFDEDARIPILFSGWNIAQGKVKQGQVRADDIVPTFLDILQMQKPSHLTGRSLATDVLVK